MEYPKHCSYCTIFNNLVDITTGDRIINDADGYIITVTNGFLPDEPKYKKIISGICSSCYRNISKKEKGTPLKGLIWYDSIEHCNNLKNGIS